MLHMPSTHQPAIDPPLAFPLKLPVPMVINNLNWGQWLIQYFNLTPPYNWTQGVGYAMLNCTNNICFTCPESPRRYNYTSYPASYIVVICTYNLTYWCPVSNYGPVPLNNTECVWWEGNIPSTGSIQFNPPMGYQAKSELAFHPRPSDKTNQIILEHFIKTFITS
eukprot:bmy_20251T0